MNDYRPRLSEVLKTKYYKRTITGHYDLNYFLNDRPTSDNVGSTEIERHKLPGTMGIVQETRDREDNETRCIARSADDSRRNLQ